MGIQLSSLNNQTATTTVEWGEESAEVVYRPSALTPAMVHDVSTEDDAEQVVAILEAVLVSWDLLDDEGNRLPTDRTVLMGLPFTFLAAVMAAVQKAMTPSGEADGSFGAG